MSFLKYTIRRILATIPIILGVMFISFIMIRFIPGNPFMYSPIFHLDLPSQIITYNTEEAIERYGMFDPFLIQFYKYLTNMMGLFWTWIILVCSAGSIGFYAYKIVYEMIHKPKNPQKVYSKYKSKRTVYTAFNGNN